jgi:hypothetical protein
MTVTLTNAGSFSIEVREIEGAAVILRPGESVGTTGDVKISSPVIADVRRLKPKPEKPPEPPEAA